MTSHQGWWVMVRWQNMRPIMWQSTWWTMWPARQLNRLTGEQELPAFLSVVGSTLEWGVNAKTRTMTGTRCPGNQWHSGYWAPFRPGISLVYKTIRLNFLCIFPISLLFENTLENQSENSTKMWDIPMGNIMIGGLWLAHAAEYFG